MNEDGEGQGEGRERGEENGWREEEEGLDYMEGECGQYPIYLSWFIFRVDLNLFFFLLEFALSCMEAIFTDTNKHY